MVDVWWMPVIWTSSPEYERIKVKINGVNGPWDIHNEAVMVKQTVPSAGILPDDIIGSLMTSLQETPQNFNINHYSMNYEIFLINNYTKL